MSHHQTTLCCKRRSIVIHEAAFLQRILQRLIPIIPSNLSILQRVYSSPIYFEEYGRWKKRAGEKEKTLKTREKKVERKKESMEASMHVDVCES